MKRITLILVLLFAFMYTYGQDDYVFGPASIEGLGSASDTLTNNDTIVDFTVRVKTQKLLKLNAGTKSTEVSGTPAYSAFLQGSFDNSTYTNIDTITHSGGGDDAGVFDQINATYNYYRIRFDGTAAAQSSVVKVYMNFRE